MRYEALTNMNTDDKKAADVLLYMSRCNKAVENIPVPEGMKLIFQLVPKGAKAIKVAKLVNEMHTKISEQLSQALNQADAASERSSRKVKKGK